MTDLDDLVARARAHAAARLPGTADVTTSFSETPVAAGFIAVRAFIPQSRPGTGTAVVLVSPQGRMLGAGIADSLAGLVEELAPEPNAESARALAELATLMTYEGNATVLAQPAPTLVADGGNLRLEATIQGALSQHADRMVIAIPAGGRPALSREPVAEEPPPTPINRAAALERALAANDAFGLQRALRAMSGDLDAREKVAIAKVALSAGGPIAVQAEQRLGSGPDADAALATAKSEL